MKRVGLWFTSREFIKYMLAKKNNIQDMNIKVNELIPLISSKYAPKFQNISIHSHNIPIIKNFYFLNRYWLLTKASGKRAIHHTKYYAVQTLLKVTKPIV